MLLAELDAIDLHHGSLLGPIPLSLFSKCSVPRLLPKAKNELSAYGFNEFHANLTGFTARRPEPVD
jgi:hypothetical protein